MGSSPSAQRAAVDQLVGLRTSCLSSTNGKSARDSAPEWMPVLLEFERIFEREPPPNEAPLPSSPPTSPLPPPTSPSPSSSRTRLKSTSAYAGKSGGGRGSGDEKPAKSEVNVLESTSLLVRMQNQRALEVRRRRAVSARREACGSAAMVSQPRW